jgi:hypothetical protein
MSAPGFCPHVQQLVAARLCSGQHGSEDDVLRDAPRALSKEESFDEIRHNVESKSPEPEGRR